MVMLSAYRSEDTNMIMADVQMLANTHMYDHGLLDQGWFFNFDRAKKRFGLCKHDDKIISMSKYFTPMRTFDENLNTILHEIAHALVGPGHGHDEVWRAKAISIGCDGERCGKLPESGERPDFRWVWKCDACGNSGGMHRAPGRVHHCKDCGPETFTLSWFQFGIEAHLGDMPEKFRNEFYVLQRKYNPESGHDFTLDEILDDLEPDYTDDQLY